MDLTGKTALITGASKGIGYEIALQLSQKKVNQALFARSTEKLKALKKECEKHGVKAEYFAGDISSETDVAKSYAHFQHALGKIDILINNAGIGVFKTFEEITPDEFDKVMNTNVRGSFLMSRIAVAQMKHRKEGHIIFVASDVSKRTFAEGSVYCASKYAQHALADALRKEVRDFGIKVSTVYPGLTDTYFAETQQGADYKSDWLKVEHIAQSVVNLLSMPGNAVIDELVIHPLSQEY